MIARLDKEDLENQTKLNLSEIYTTEEIKLLKKSIPNISNIIYMASNNEHNNTDNSKLNKDQMQHTKYRYFSSIRKIKDNTNISFLIDKEKFYSLILDTIKQYFEKEQNIILIKSISLIMDEMLNLSKMLKQNLIYRTFFKSIKNTKILDIKKPTKSHSHNREKPNKSIKVNSGITKNDSKNNTNTELNIKINEKINNNTHNKVLKYIDTNNNMDVKKHLSFKMDTETSKNNKSLCDMNLSVNIKNKDKTPKGNLILKNSSNANSISKKKNTSIAHMKNKNKGSFNMRKLNKNLNIHRKNLTSTNNTSNPKKTNNNFRMGQTKISLKKVNNENKNIGLYSITNNKNEYNLTNTYQNKKFDRNKDNKSFNKNTEKNEKIILNKYCSPSSIDSSLYINIETQEFNIFKLEKKIGRVNILPLIGYYVFNVFSFNEIIKYNKFEKWCQTISDGYIRQNYYHNDLHAADVTHTCLLYFALGDILNIHNFSKFSICSLFFSCMCHDYKHPGVNNNYLKETNNKLSIRYNDASILENMHISATFKLILNDIDCNIFDGVDKNLYKEMRKEMISCVLATDMAFHNLYVDLLKNYINEVKDGKNKENNNEKSKDKSDKNQKFMNLLIHSADISNPTKLFDIYFEWAKLVVEEFWDQGDKEKRLNLPCSCDREKVTIYKSQLGFINFIEIPYFSLFSELYPKLKFFYENLVNNKNILLSMEEKEKEKEKGNEKEKTKSK